MYVLYVFSLTWHLEYTWDEIHETLSKNKYKGEVKSIRLGGIFILRSEKVSCKGLRIKCSFKYRQYLKNLLGEKHNLCML